MGGGYLLNPRLEALGRVFTDQGTHKGVLVAVGFVET